MNGNISCILFSLFFYAGSMQIQMLSKSIRESNSGRNSKAVLVLLHRHVCGLHGVVTAKEPFRKKKTRWNNRRHDPRFLEALESDRA